MRNIAIRNMIELILILYIIITTILYFITENIPQEELLEIKNSLEHKLSGGIYTRLAIEHSKILNTILSLFTIFISISLYKFRNHKKTP